MCVLALVQIISCDELKAVENIIKQHSLPIMICQILCIPKFQNDQRSLIAKYMYVYLCTYILILWLTVAITSKTMELNLNYCA